VNPPERFETERLFLRKPGTDDANAIFSAYAQDPKVTPYLTWRPHKSVEETHAILEQILKLWTAGEAYSFAIIVKDSDALIGMIAMHPDGLSIGIGYVLARPHWGQGYMTEAVRKVADWAIHQPDIYRVFATCDMENLASARVMEKAGMQREGILRKYIVHPNISDVPRDSYIYAIVK
jgi:RimJ/RimL family protein N-acetyltransferase